MAVDLGYLTTWTLKLIFLDQLHCEILAPDLPLLCSGRLRGLLSWWSSSGGNCTSQRSAIQIALLECLVCCAKTSVSWHLRWLQWSVTVCVCCWRYIKNCAYKQTMYVYRYTWRCSGSEGMINIRVWGPVGWESVGWIASQGPWLVMRSYFQLFFFIASARVGTCSSLPTSS